MGTLNLALGLVDLGMGFLALLAGLSLARRGLFNRPRHGLQAPPSGSPLGGLPSAYRKVGHGMAAVGALLVGIGLAALFLPLEGNLGLALLVALLPLPWVAGLALGGILSAERALRQLARSEKGGKGE